MKILLDNCVPKRAKRLLAGHDVHHASEVKMSSLENGMLMRAAADMGFDVLVTVDQKIRYEHDLRMLPIAVLELDTRDTRFPALQTMVAHFEPALAQTTSHRFVSLSQNGQISCLA